MAAQVLPWVQATEAVVGLNHPTLTDVENRPLRTLLTLCGLNPDTAFNGLRPVYNLKASGAVGDRAIDDYTNINNFYLTIPDGSAMYVPEGAFRHTQKFSFNRNIDIIGTGPSSAFVPDLNSTTVDAIVINDHATQLMYRVRIDGIAVLSEKANACRDAFVCNRLNLSEVNVHVKVSSTRYGARLVGCLISKFRIVSSVNVVNVTQVVAGGYPYPCGMPVSSVVRIQRDTVNAYSFNNNDLQVHIEGGNEGLWIEDQSSQGNNRISGVIEGVLGKGLYAKGCIGLHITDLHCEANTLDAELDTCSACTIGGGSLFLPPGVYSATSGRITLTASNRITLDALYCDNLVVGTTCSKIYTTGAFRYGAGGTGTSIITDTAHILQGPTGPICGSTASVATATPTTLIDLSTRGAGRYSVVAYIANGGTAFHAVADFFYDGTSASRIAGTNAASMTTTLSGTNLQATQTSGGNAVISYIILFVPTV